MTPTAAGPSFGLNPHDPGRREGALCVPQTPPLPTHPLDPVSRPLTVLSWKALGSEAGLPSGPICSLMFNPTSLHIIHTRETRVGVGLLPNHYLPGLLVFHLSLNSS